MKTLLWLFVLSLTVANVHAEDTSARTDLATAYLAQWFSIDPKQASRVELGAQQQDAVSHIQVLRFESDDGVMVNGQIAAPDKRYKGSPRLALMLHPMGADQSFWWDAKHSLQANRIAQELRKSGHTVVSLDARLHGKRIPKVAPRELITKARSRNPRVYLDAIIGTVRDYKLLLRWAQNKIAPESVMLFGYSMGAQMSILLAAQAEGVDRVVAMVPPYIDNPYSPVAPRVHAANIQESKLLWLAAKQDQFSNQEQTQRSFDAVVSPAKELIWFDSGHRLPINYVDTVLAFIDRKEGQ